MSTSRHQPWCDIHVETCHGIDHEFGEVGVCLLQSRKQNRPIRVALYGDEVGYYQELDPEALRAVITVIDQGGDVALSRLRRIAEAGMIGASDKVSR